MFVVYRLYGISMDSLILDCSLSTNKLKGSKKIVTVSNILIEGARIHRNSLIDNTIDSPSVSIVVEINLAWIPKVINSFSLILLELKFFSSQNFN